MTKSVEVAGDVRTISETGGEAWVYDPDSASEGHLLNLYTGEMHVITGTKQTKVAVKAPRKELYYTDDEKSL